jgi:ABC-2 type transport system ATP-binding protein
MISLKNLYIKNNAGYLSDVSLQVQNNEIYFFLNHQGLSNDYLFSVLSGFRAPDKGEIFYDESRQVLAEHPAAVSLINKVADVADFETEASIGNWLDFLCCCGKLPHANVLQTLMVLNFNEMNLQKKVRNLTPEIFRQVYLALCLARDETNIVINDFSKGMDKHFEIKFNKLLWQKKTAGKAIFYLGNDILYAAEIADRVGFIKDGNLLFEAAAVDIKDMDINELHYKFLS